MVVQVAHTMLYYTLFSQNFIAEEISAMYEKIGTEIETQIQRLSGTAAASANTQQMATLQNLSEMLKSSSQSREVAMTAVNLVQKVCLWFK